MTEKPAFVWPLIATKHLDLKKREVRVETRVDQYGDEDVTKTEAGERSVPWAGRWFSF